MVNESGMSTTEVRQIKAGDEGALGDGVLGLLPGVPPTIAKNKNQPRWYPSPFMENVLTFIYRVDGP